MRDQDTKPKPSLDPRVQWLLLRGTLPALSAKDFGPSPTMFHTIARRFSLMDQFHQGAGFMLFDSFARRIRTERIEASRVILPAHPSRELYVMAPRGHKEDAARSLSAIVRNSPALKTLLDAPDLMAAWQSASTPEGRVVGGYDIDHHFLFTLNRPSIEDAKALFGVHENAGRYKPRPERDPAFISHGHIGAAVVAYPQQIEKARQHLMYFLHSATDEKRTAFCFVAPEIARQHQAALLQAFDETPMKIVVCNNWPSPLYQAADIMHDMAQHCPVNGHRMIDNMRMGLPSQRMPS